MKWETKRYYLVRAISSRHIDRRLSLFTVNLESFLPSLDWDRFRRGFLPVSLRTVFFSWFLFDPFASAVSTFGRMAGCMQFAQSIFQGRSIKENTERILILFRQIRRLNYWARRSTKFFLIVFLQLLFVGNDIIDYTNQIIKAKTDGSYE